MLTCHHVAAIHESSEQGKYCSSGFAAFSRLIRNINYLLYFYFNLLHHFQARGHKRRPNLALVFHVYFVL